MTRRRRGTGRTGARGCDEAGSTATVRRGGAGTEKRKRIVTGRTRRTRRTRRTTGGAIDASGRTKQGQGQK